MNNTIRSGLLAALVAAAPAAAQNEPQTALRGNEWVDSRGGVVALSFFAREA